MKKAPLPFDPFALAQAAGEAAIGLRRASRRACSTSSSRRPSNGRDFWTGAMSGKADATSRATAASRRTEWQDDPYYRAIRDAYLLASKQLRETVDKSAGNGSHGAMARFLLDQYLNAISPSNFAATNPGGREADQGNRRRQPRPGLPAPAGGRRQRQGHRPAAHRPERVREGQDDRRDARARSCSRTSCSS